MRSDETELRVQVLDTSVIVRVTTTTNTTERAELQQVIADSPVAITHVLTEAYSTLTRLPQPFRLSPRSCLTFLSAAFHATPLAVSVSGQRRVMELLAENGVTGGAIYDCLIAETARENGATLVSLDQRALRNYALVGVEHQLL